MLGYIAVFGTLTYQQQSNYGTYGFDMGIYDQGIWLVSHFKNPFVTIRGLDYFGHHVNIITLLFVPAYWLGAGPHFLYAVETVWLAAGAIPIWLLARDRLESSWTALGLSAAYLLYPSVEWINRWQFHPDALIITPLMFAYWLATRQRWGWFWAAVAIALSCKEDAGLAVFALGICLWLKHRQRAQGLVTAIAGAAWFLICTKLIIPFANGGGAPLLRHHLPGPRLIDLLDHRELRGPPQQVDQIGFRTVTMDVLRASVLAGGAPPVARAPGALIAIPQLFVNTSRGHQRRARHPLLPHGDRGRRGLLGHRRGLRKAGPHGGRSAIHGRADRVRRPREQCGLGTLTDQCQLPQRVSGSSRAHKTRRSTRRSASCRRTHRCPPRTTSTITWPTGSDLRVPEPMDRDELGIDLKQAARPIEGRLARPRHEGDRQPTALYEAPIGQTGVHGGVQRTRDIGPPPSEARHPQRPPLAMNPEPHYRSDW